MAPRKSKTVVSASTSKKTLKGAASPNKVKIVQKDLSKNKKVRKKKNSEPTTQVKSAMHTDDFHKENSKTTSQVKSAMHTGDIQKENSNTTLQVKSAMHTDDFHKENSKTTSQVKSAMHTGDIPHCRITRISKMPAQLPNLDRDLSTKESLEIKKKIQLNQNDNENNNQSSRSSLQYTSSNPVSRSHSPSDYGSCDIAWNEFNQEATISNLVKFAEDNNIVTNTQPTDVHRFFHADCIPPPILLPRSFGSEKIQMSYNSLGNNDYEVTYSNEKDKQNPRAKAVQINRGINLKPREKPYNRRTEAAACTQFEYRENVHIRNRLGKRYLKAGSVGVCFVLSEDRSYILSNPLEIAASLPVDLVSAVESQLSTFLQTNPVNRQSVDNPAYQRSSEAEGISGNMFVESLKNCVEREGSILRCLLIVNSYVTELESEFAALALKMLLIQPVSLISLGCEVNELTEIQVYHMLSYLVVITPEYFLNSVRLKASEASLIAWDAIVKAVRQWKVITYFTEPVTRKVVCKS